MDILSIVSPFGSDLRLGEPAIPAAGSRRVPNDQFDRPIGSSTLSQARRALAYQFDSVAERIVDVRVPCAVLKRAGKDDVAAGNFQADQ